MLLKKAFETENIKVTRDARFFCEKEKWEQNCTVPKNPSSWIYYRTVLNTGGFEILQNFAKLVNLYMYTFLRVTNVKK